MYYEKNGKVLHEIMKEIIQGGSQKPSCPNTQPDTKTNNEIDVDLPFCSIAANGPSPTVEQDRSRILL